MQFVNFAVCGDKEKFPQIKQTPNIAPPLDHQIFEDKKNELLIPSRDIC